MKIYTIGAGFVSQHLPYENINERLLCNAAHIGSILDLYKPNVLINCIGKTGVPNVDWCESNKSITAEVNTALPIILAEECAKRKIHLIHIGSGCIFYGPSNNYMYTGLQLIDYGWRETDFANPESFYSKTKYAADLAIGNMDNVAILRIRMPISSKNLSRNLISKLRKYDKVIDIPNSVTFMDDLVRCVDWAVKNTVTGIWHVTNPQTLTAAQIMKEFQKYNSNHQFSIINEGELGSLTIAKRSNCTLDTSKLVTAGFTMNCAEDALKKCMAEYIKNI